MNSARTIETGVVIGIAPRTKIVFQWSQLMSQLTTSGNGYTVRCVMELIVDRYQEALTREPFPCSLEQNLSRGEKF